MPSEVSPRDHLHDDLSAFAVTVEGTSLYLLRAVDLTVETLQIGENIAQAIAAAAASMTRKIANRKPVSEAFMDPDDVAINGLESGYKALEQFLPSLLVNKDRLTNDAKLSGGQGELLHVAYERCIKALAELIEITKDLRAAVIKHDLAAESKTKEGFKSVDDLLNSLHSL